MCKLHKMLTVTATILLLLCGELDALLTVALKAATGRFNPEYLSNLTVAIKNESVYLDLVIIKPLTSGFKAKSQFQLRLSNSKKYQSLFSPTVDVCAVVISMKDTLFKKWLESLVKVGNFMEYCPINEGHYYAHGWRMDSSLFPSFLHPGNYRLSVYVFYGKTKTAKEDFIMQVGIEVVVKRT